MNGTNLKKLLAGGLAAALCLLSGCTGNPDSKEDPLSGYTVDGLLPFETRDPLAAATATPTPQPGSTAIISVTQSWQNETGPAGQPDPTPAATKEKYTFVRLEQGKQGDDVRRLQNRLIELGYLSGTADGNYGANTKSAVKLFQKELGLSQTGVATVSLQEKLFMSTAPTYSSAVAVTMAPEEDEADGYTALVRGDVSLAVQTLQNRLIQLGYLTGGADGKFGKNTENAVKAFQAQLGLSQTGVASASLQTQLFSATAPYASVQATAKPTAAPTQAQTGDSEYTALEPGDTGSDVTRMQNRLKELGYFTGTATGNYYKETTSAVQRFQAALGLSETGIASSSLLSRLYSSSAPVYSGGTTAAATAVPYTTLQRGTKGTEVMNLQKRLISLGYMSTAADGDYGSRTENAVILFQQATGYTADGIASVALQQLLFSDAAPVYSVQSTAIPTQISTQAPTSAPAGYQRLEPGNTGEAVKELQTRLKELGFFSGLIGGNYLTKTTDAVRLFQAAIGHTETGIATPEMQAVLHSDAAPDYSSVESEYVNLEKLDSGIQVVNLQQRLIDLGYLTGSADGDFGSKTESAVKAFQTRAGLEATGKASPATQELLFAETAPHAPQPTQAATTAPTQIPTQSPTQAPAPSGYSSLSYGNSGADVVALQTRLNDLGYFEGLLGGNFLTRTETAVKLFQAALGLTPDGVASASLQETLFSDSAPAYTGSGLIDLFNGSEGVAVRRLQQRLIDLGWLTGSADGDFGGGTESAVKAFQKAAGYTQDGVASVALQQTLFSDSAPSNSVQATAVPPAVTDAPAEPEGPRSLSNGSTGDDVVALQRRLIELGWLTGSADGDFGGGTESAVRAIQAAMGYTQDGVATPALQDAIFASSAPVYVPSEPEDTGYPTLSFGSTGEDVKAVQRRLMELGYFDGDIGGNYLTKTEAAVKQFQAAIGFTQDGVASPELQDILFASNAPSFSASVRPEQLVVLLRGDTGSPVKSLQQRLIELGWLTGSADGDFGGGTEQALMAFQYRMGMELDGVASIELQEILYAVDAPLYVEYQELLPGAEGDEVLAMQNRLIELGYLEETLANQDGIFGAGLQNALLELQAAWYQATERDPVTANGIATVELQTFLFSENANLFAIMPDIG